MPLEEVVPISVFMVIATSLSAGFLHKKADRVDRKAASLVLVGMLGGAHLGARFFSELQGPWLEWVFGVLFALASLMMLVSSYFQAWQNRLGGSVQKARDQEAPTVTQALLLVFFCLVAGFCAALMGIGGGIFVVTVLTLLLNKSFQRAAATSNFVVGVSAATAALVYWRQNLVNEEIAVWIALGALLGAPLGVRVMEFVSSLWLKRVFAGLLFVFAMRVLL